MRLAILSFRLSRRGVAAVALADETLSFQDGRHLSSNGDRAIAATERYVRRVLELTRPTLVVIDAPYSQGSLASRLFAATQSIVAAAGLPTELSSISDLLASYGLPGLRSRKELVQVTEQFWPELAGMKGKIRPYVVEAAALALYTEVRHSLGIAAPT